MFFRGLRSLSAANLFVALLLAVSVTACDFGGTGALWHGDPEELVGVWEARDRIPEGLPYLSFDYSGVYNVVLQTPSQAIEIERGTYSVDDGTLVRTPTKALDPYLIGITQRNGIYDVTPDTMTLDSAEASGPQLYYDRVNAFPSHRPLP